MLKNEQQKGLKKKVDVVKVPNCTYFMEEKESFFYLCSCQNDKKGNEEEFFPICSACMESCHPLEKGHQPTRHEGKYNCKCGEEKHIPRTAEPESRTCFFTKFQNIIGNPTVYSLKDESSHYCELCYENCLSKDLIKGQPALQKKCMCDKHESIGVLNIEKTVKDIKSFKDDLPNFNINFFLVDADFQQKTIFYFSNRISKCITENKCNDQDFFIDYQMYKILSTFCDLKDFFKNDNVTLYAEKFLEVQQGYESLDKNIIRETGEKLLMSEVVDNNIQDSEFKILCESKLLFAYFIYYLSYHPYFIKFNNDCFNQYSIANMNLIQRHIYIHQYKSFYKFNNYKASKEDEDIGDVFGDLTRYVEVVVKLFDNLTEKREVLQIDLIEKSFQLYNSLVKTMMKRGLLSDLNVESYFDTVYKTLKKLEDDDAEKFSFTIVKNIYYAMLYNNDKLLIKKLRGEDVNECDFSHYSSKKNESNDIINKVFLKILNINRKTKESKFERNKNKTKTIHHIMNFTFKKLSGEDEKEKRNSKEEEERRKWRKKLQRFDYYVNRILDMSVGASDGNRLSLYNIVHTNDAEVVNTQLDKVFSINDYPNYFTKYLTADEDSNQKKPYFQIIVEITEEMLEANRLFLQYRQGHNCQNDYRNYDGSAFRKYMKKFETNIKNLKKLINAELKSIPSPKTNIFMENFGESAEENNRKINKIKDAVKFSNFFQAVNGFIRIFADNKDNKNNKWKEDIPDWDQHINFLFRFIFMFIKDENNSKKENLVFLSMLDVKSFVSTFEDDKNFNDFISSLNEMHFGKVQQEYQFDNFIFMEKLISEIILSTDENKVKDEIRNSKEEKFRHSKKLILGIRVTRKMIRHVSHRDASQLDILELLKLKLHQLFGDREFKHEILLELMDTSKFPEANKKTVHMFLTRYFILCNEIYKNDMSFFNVLDEEQFISIAEANQLMETTFRKNDDNRARPLLNEQNGVLLVLSVLEYLALKQYYIPYDITTTRLTNLFKSQPLMKRDGSYTGHYFTRDNLNLSNLGDYEKTRNGTVNDRKNYIKLFHKNLNKKVQSLIEHTKIFISLCDENIIHKIKSLVIKRASVMSYFENAVMRPCYSLINQFLFYPSEIYNISLQNVRDLVKTFLDCLKKLWDIISRSDSLKDDQREVDTFKKLDLLNMEMLFKPDEIQFGEKMNSLNQEYENVTNKLKFFQILEIIKIFNNFVKEYTKVDKDNERMFNKKDQSDRDKIDDGIKNKIFKVNSATKYLKYERLFFKPEETEIAENISLIKVVKEVDSEEVKNLGENLFYYLFELINDRHTTDHYKDWDDYEKARDNKILCSESGIHQDKKHYFNVQHLYFFRVMNKLFEMDFQTYQEIIKNFFVKDFKKFKSFLKLTINFNIISSTIFECKKYYQIKRPAPLGSITLETTKNSIKFLQNLCEGHNLYFQDTLFRLRIYDFDSDFDEEDFELFIIDPNIYKSLTNRNYMQEKLAKYVNYANVAEIKIEKYLNKNFNDDKRLKKFLNKKFTFVNSLFIMLKLSIMHSHYSDNVTDLFDSNVRETSGLEIIRERVHELVLEMIQGTKEDNFLKIYSGKGVKNILFKDEGNDFTNDFDKYLHDEVEKYSFLKYLIEVRYMYNQVLSNSAYTKQISPETTKLIYYAFKIITGIISQQKKEEEGLYRSVLYFFPLDCLLKISVQFLNKIAESYNINTRDEVRKPGEFSKVVMENFMENFKTQESIFDDELFKFPAEIFLFITIIQENFEHFETQALMKEVMEIKQKEYKSRKNKALPEGEGVENSAENNEEETVYKDNQLIFEEMKESNEVHDEFQKENEEKRLFDNNKIHTSIFFSSLIKKVEFLIKNSEGKSSPKIIYFITNPKTYQISKPTLQYFIDNVDRKSATTKLRALIGEIDMFKSEVDFKDKGKEEDHLQTNKTEFNKYLEFKYGNIDVFNFSISCVINLILLLFLKNEDFVKTSYFQLIIFLSLILIGTNVFFIYKFFSTKFSYILNIEKERVIAKNIRESESSELRFGNLVDIYFNSIFHDDIALFYFNALVVVICIYSKYAIFLYPLLLFSVVKFVPIIKDVVVAFQLSYKQILEMIGFLAILIYFYANLGFFYMTKEFDMTLDAGQANVCGTLLECFITYFNFGIRSGGGIGDVLGPQAYADTQWYWIRWITDMIFYITVILLIMNMINGIIITTFSTKRKIKEEIEQDQMNKCFICSQHNIKFLSVKKDFNHHIKYEHNYKNYIRYFFVIKSTNEKELDADQSFIKQCMKNDDIGFFPVAESLYLPKTSENEEEEE